MNDPNNYDPRLSAWLPNAVVREGLRDSEIRIHNAFAEIFAGYDKRAEDVLNDVIHVEKYSGLVTVENISFYTYCQHHFAPFFGTADVTYQPQTIVTGLGKIVRLVRDVHARRLQIQESMTRDIAMDIQRVLGAQGVSVRTKAKHLCMCSRGPSDDGCVTVVEFGLGTLERYPAKT